MSYLVICKYLCSRYWLTLSLWFFFCFAFSFSRGVSINVLRHEAEFYGITPLGNFFLIWSHLIFITVVMTHLQVLGSCDPGDFQTMIQKVIWNNVMLPRKWKLWSYLVFLLSEKIATMWRTGTLILWQCPFSWLPASSRYFCIHNLMLLAVTYCFSLWGRLAEVVTLDVKLSREGFPMERLRWMVESNIVLIQKTRLLSLCCMQWPI